MVYKFHLFLLVCIVNCSGTILYDNTHTTMLQNKHACYLILDAKMAHSQNLAICIHVQSLELRFINCICSCWSITVVNCSGRMSTDHIIRECSHHNVTKQTCVLFNSRCKTTVTKLSNWHTFTPFRIAFYKLYQFLLVQYSSQL